MLSKPRIVATLLALATATVSAHTPYLAPNTFAPQQGATVALDAAFTESLLIPDIAFDGGSFTVTGPDGKSITPDTLQTYKTRTIVEQTLPNMPGTWRFSTGTRLGAHFRTWVINGKRESSRDDSAKIPAGAKVLANFQSRTRAETYVTAGAPDRGALQAHGEGLEIVAIDHPNDLYAGESFAFRVDFDGKPLANQPVKVTEVVWNSDRKPKVIELTTDAAGKASLPLQQAGTWVALSRYRSPAPAGAVAPEYSNSYTLTFRVLSP